MKKIKWLFILVFLGFCSCQNPLFSVEEKEEVLIITVYEYNRKEGKELKRAKGFFPTYDFIPYNLSDILVIQKYILMPKKEEKE